MVEVGVAQVVLEGWGDLEEKVEAVPLPYFSLIQMG